MDYASVCRVLDSAELFGIKPGLLRIQAVLGLLKDAHFGIDFIHIVGTNGKTSVTKFTSAILHAHGIRCAHYISPHIRGYTERISIAGKEISRERFARYFTELLPFIEEVNRMDLDGEMSQFEILTALFFYCAIRQKVQAAVMEAGMGGRWDATNVVDAKVVGFTDVSLEHTKILGSTIEKIAWEKAMVIKQGASVATCSKKKKVLDVIGRRVDETGSRLFVYGKDFKLTNLDQGWLQQGNVSIRGICGTYEDVPMLFLGDYQPYNLAISVALSELYLQQAGIRPDQQAMAAGAKNAKIYGRLEVLQEDPMLIVDASHNPEGIKNLMKNLAHYDPKAQKIIIFSVLADKDYRKMIREVSAADVLILTTSGHARSLPVDVLAQEAKKNMPREGKKIYCFDNIAESLKFALNIAKTNDIICLTGSITNLECIYKDFV